MLSAAIQQGDLLWLVIIGVLCAAVSAYYYFRVIIAMYFKPGEADAQGVTPGFKALLVVAAAIVIVLGIFPNLLLQYL